MNVVETVFGDYVHVDRDSKPVNQFIVFLVPPYILFFVECGPGCSTCNNNTSCETCGYQKYHIENSGECGGKCFSRCFGMDMHIGCVI